MPAAQSSIFISANDGLRLHARCYGDRTTELTPVVCLPGLARTAQDFDLLAQTLSAQGRRVIALDYRGRGLSDYDRDPANYTVQTELTDVLTILAALEATPAIVIGTSRGGILAMLLAAVSPATLAAVVLNDIGPVIEPEGLMRIKGYVGKLPEPASFEDAAVILKRHFSAQFPKLSDADWLASAHRGFKQDNGRIVPNYDVRLADTLSEISPDKPLPAMWPQFDALAGLPLMVIRGALSGLLSRQTVAAMKARHPTIDTLEVPDQGHAPLLQDKATIAAIERFVAAV